MTHCVGSTNQSSRMSHRDARAMRSSHGSGNVFSVPVALAVKKGNDTSSHDGNQGCEEEHGYKQGICSTNGHSACHRQQAVLSRSHEKQGNKKIAPLARHYDGSGEEPRTEGNQARSMTIRVTLLSPNQGAGLSGWPTIPDQCQRPTAYTWVSGPVLDGGKQKTRHYGGTKSRTAFHVHATRWGW